MRMTIEEAKKLLIVERNCVRRAEVCNRECNTCELVQDTDKLLEMYDETVKRLEKLKEYEDLEERGRLISLPCKVGDTLYYTDAYYNAVVPVRVNEVITQFAGFNNYVYQYNGCSFDECGDVYEEYEFDNNDFSKTVFLTKSEAEEKLKELRGESNRNGKI